MKILTSKFLNNLYKNNPKFTGQLSERIKEIKDIFHLPSSNVSILLLNITVQYLLHHTLHYIVFLNIWRVSCKNVPLPLDTLMCIS